MWAFVPRVPRPCLEIVPWHALGIAHLKPPECFLKPPQRLLKPPPFASAQPLLIQEGSPGKAPLLGLRRGGAPATGVVEPEMQKLNPRVPRPRPNPAGKVEANLGLQRHRPVNTSFKTA